MGLTDREAMEHQLVVKDVDNEMYPYLVTCTCAWQACAKTEDQALYFKRNHESQALWIQATKGWQRGH